MVNSRPREEKVEAIPISGAGRYFHEVEMVFNQHFTQRPIASKYR